MSHHVYKTDDLEVVYDAPKCIHFGACVRGNSAVFNPDNKPWVQPEAASVEEVVSVVEQCPTGALSYRRLDGGPAEQPAPENTVTLEKGGPVYLRGNLRIETPDGEVVETERVALCRCGASEHKPFCDGRHSKVEFTDPGQVGTAKAKGGPEAQSHLRVRVLTDGPVILDGPYKIYDAGGEMCFETGGGSLCRCGASSNKPFCDGQHKQIGFEG